MFFGISMTLSGWFWAFVAAVFLMLAPLIAIGTFAEKFPEPINVVLTVVGTYLVWPMFVAWLFKSKLRKTGRGSVIFYFYVAFYVLFFLLLLSRIFNDGAEWHDYLGVLVLGAVSLGLVAFAYKTKLQLNADIAEYQSATYEAERSDDIQRQAEAILLAEKMKKGES